MQEISKIVVIGPESTGKSTLCQSLATHFKSLWCPEFAREYLLAHGTKYTFDDLLVIAKGQIALEEEYASRAIDMWISNGKKTNKPILFVDTDMYVMKVWCEYVFGKVHPFITDEIAAHKPNLYLLCNTDLPWVKDELREYPDLESRKELYSIYRNLLNNQPVRWVNIYGNYADRFKIAVEAVTGSLNN